MASQQIDRNGICKAARPLTDEPNRAVSERHQRVELSMVRGYERSRHTQGQRKAESIGERDCVVALEDSRFLPVGSVIVAAGSNPRQATSAVIIMGRRRSKDAWYVASRMLRPSSRSLLMNETRMTAVSTETPMRASSPSTDDTLKGV